MTYVRAAAYTEVISLVLMLANLATAHIREISSLLGPLHGCAYLVVVIGVLRLPSAGRRARLLAFLPGIGGWLSIRSMETAARGGAAE
ncbi:MULTISPECIES: hypothetical protein [Nonomuraea]|uniref:DUF3817 domain-containing protein n=1 Tax=Nonomuraea mangrovi TaxID=2316207 RepID=A0ABW4TFH9_9ACTN